MTYTLPSSLMYISCPIILMIDGKELEYPNGAAAADEKFEKYYVVDHMYADNSRVVVVLKENERINDTNWCGEEQISFF